MSAIVWFKKDLRVHDNEALFRGNQNSQCMALYIVEPEWIKSYEFDPSHWQFLKDSLKELQVSLDKLGIPLVFKVGSATSVFSEIYQQWPYTKVYSHLETGVDWTYQRDIKLKYLFKEKGIEWHEYQQFGVVRPSINRDRWASQRNLWLKTKEFITHRRSIDFVKSVPSKSLEEIEQMLHVPKNQKKIQVGGETSANQTLHSFLQQRSREYLEHISKPHLSAQSASRLSAYLSYGNLSLRHVHRQTSMRKQNLHDHQWQKNLTAFESRLWWHCHFIQKLESEPEIEFENMNRQFDQLRESEFNESSFEAWKTGNTGVPIIDAVMRCLLQTGWINFRMRAMLVSFASYQLWLDWRKTSHFLAKHFLDFEPGIHFSQFQMQSGVTGINTIRIYSPEKQTTEQDLNGEFIFKYCPELSQIPHIYLTNPANTPPLIQMEANCRIGKDYPEPIVDLKESYQKAKQRIYEWKSRSAVKAASKRVYLRHGSREGAHFPKQKRT